MAGGRSSFRNWSEYIAVRSALATLSWTPAPLAESIAQVYAKALDQFVPRLRRIALDNLRQALPGSLDPERSAIVDGVFRSIGRILFTFARIPRIRSGNVAQYIRCEGLCHVQTALARGKGLLFATAHLGNWELSAYAFALMERPISIVVRPLDNPLIDRLVSRYREMSGNRFINKRDYARGILQSLARNEMVGILADQHVQDGIFVDFFGRLATTSPGIAKFAAKTGAAVVPGFALWSESEKMYVLRFLPEVRITGDVQGDSQRVQAAIESVIRQYPDQWLWIHRRWKAQVPVN